MDARWGWLALWGVISSCTQPVAPGSRTEGIVDGDFEPGEPAVVLVYNRRAGGMCTGAIIAERLVLTAKHCVQEPGESEPSDPRSFIVGVGSSIRGLSESLTVESISTTEGVYTDGGFGLRGALVGQDVATMTLTRPTDIEPIPIRRDRPDDVVGEEVTVIGFGQTPSGDVGRKYRARTQLYELRNDLLVIGASICQGDSGGPMITDAGEIIGVASFGTASCGRGSNAYNAIYDYADLIDEALRASGTCVPDGPEVCDGSDNDCNDQVDEVCTPIGGACSTDDECESGLCAEVGGSHICTAECDPSRPALGCPPGLYCARQNGCDGVCAPGAPGDAVVGAACEADADCASLLCLELEDGSRRCSDSCRGGSGACLAGEVCSVGPGDCGGCVPATPERARHFGEPCANDTDCTEGTCLDDRGARYCTRACADDSECEAGFHCRDGSCVRGHREGIGGSCVSNDDCSDETMCASSGGAAWCTAFCEPGASDCPEGFHCTETPQGSVCAPVRGLLGESCTEDADCTTGLCVGEVCARQCGTQSPCPTGFECRRGEELQTYCQPPRVPEPGGGGCTLADRGSRTGTVPWLLVAGIAWTITRMRRRSRRPNPSSGVKR